MQYVVFCWGWQTQWLSWETHTLATPLWHNQQPGIHLCPRILHCDRNFDSYHIFTPVVYGHSSSRICGGSDHCACLTGSDQKSRDFSPYFFPRPFFSRTFFSVLFPPIFFSYFFSRIFFPVLFHPYFFFIWERCATGNDATGSHVSGSDDRKLRHRKWRYFPAFFSY